jgi:hypothetical protein
MAIGLYSRTRCGPCKESSAHYATVTACRCPLHASSFQKPGLTTSRHKDHLTTPSPDADALERHTVYDAHPIGSRLSVHI